MTSPALAIAPIPLDRWMAERLGIPPAVLTRGVIDRYHLHALQETLEWARKNSTHYAHLLKVSPSKPLRSLEEFSCIPFTYPEDLVARPSGFLCMSQDQITRIVTLNSSGTTGTPRRVFFTAEDQERALDFFAYGVTGIASPGDRMFIALPCDREGSVGRQLALGIARAGVVSIPHGPSIDPVRTLQRMDEESATSIIGLPVQVLALARHPSALAAHVFRCLHSIVLCSDHVPASIVRALRQRSGCEIFQHYGSTEMGLGGGVDCDAHTGYHLREADLYFEIVSPETGKILPDGELGEVVFTTLGRTGMPLIRYRTGDISRILPGGCDCGSPLRCLEPINTRIGGSISFGSCGSLTIAMLDEVLFALPGLLDFKASVVRGRPNHLNISVYSYGTAGSQVAIHDALAGIPAIAANCSAGSLQLNLLLSNEPFPVTSAKRTIEVHESQ